MPDIYNCQDLDHFRRETERMPEPWLLANVIMHHGALNALMTLRECGCSAEALDSMINSVERIVGVVEQVAAERGIDLPFEHHIGTLPPKQEEGAQG